MEDCEVVVDLAIGVEVLMERRVLEKVASIVTGNASLIRSLER